LVWELFLRLFYWAGGVLSGWRSIGWSAGFDTTVSSLYILNDYEHGVGWMNGSIGRDGMGIGMPFFGFEGTYISL